jgi:hypothetical protein
VANTHLTCFRYLGSVSASGPVLQVASNVEGCSPLSSVTQHSKDRLLRSYMLPKFPVDVTNALLKGDTSIVSCRSLRAKIVGCLYEDLLEKVGR